MRNIYLLITSLLLLLPELYGQQVHFVNHAVLGGAQSGTSWADAFHDLQQALAIATNGDEIWVAKGTYYPTSGTDRSISFVLKNGVKIYGGFLGLENNFAQRDFEQNETILSGNIGLPQGSDNSSHVLYGEGLDSTTVLDGFVVTKGNAKNTNNDENYGGGLLLNPSFDVHNTCPIIQNCRFEFNFAAVGGALAIYRWHATQNYVNPIIRNCQFISNRSSIFGGAMAKIGPSLPDHPFVISHCLFSKNAVSGGDGSGIYFSNAENVTMLRHCIFEKDTARLSLGGGIYFSSGYEEFVGATLTMDSCTFKENEATEGGAFYYIYGGIPSFSTPPFKSTLSSCIFENNIASNGYGGAYCYIGFDKSSFTIDVLDCEFKGNLSGTNYTTCYQTGKESNSFIWIKNCKYFDNKRLGNPTLHCFPLAFGIGGLQSRLDARVENCIFVGNGGGIASLCTLNGGGINTYITNCTFFENHKFVFNKSYYSVFNGIDHFANTYLKNCLIWQPGSSVWDMFSDNNFMINELGGYSVDNCMLSLDSSIVISSPIFGSNNIAETDPLFASVANGDFRLQPCSPAVNAGNNQIVDSLNILTDLDGLPRIQFGTVDIGAYETQDSCIIIGSTEPQKALITATLSPNPISPGNLLDVQISDWTDSVIEWMLWDAVGRPIVSGNNLLSQNQHFSIAAPDSPGIYFVELRSGVQSVWLKFVVQE